MYNCIIQRAQGITCNVFSLFNIFWHFCSSFLVYIIKLTMFLRKQELNHCKTGKQAEQSLFFCLFFVKIVLYYLCTTIMFRFDIKLWIKHNIDSNTTKILPSILKRIRFKFIIYCFLRWRKMTFYVKRKAGKYRSIKLSDPPDSYQKRFYESMTGTW